MIVVGVIYCVGCCVFFIVCWLVVDLFYMCLVVVLLLYVVWVWILCLFVLGLFCFLLRLWFVFFVILLIEWLDDLWICFLGWVFGWLVGFVI